MQVDPSTGFPAAGRRRVTTLTKEEWREALEQQRREKEELQRKPRHESDNQTHDHATDVNGGSALPLENAEPALNNRSGRRFVAAMSADEWKASLARQIREKEQQREQQKRGYTAPEHDAPVIEQPPTTETPRSQSASVVPSCLPALAEDATTLAGRRRRGGAPQQSREEYLSSLQEQIELKKKREEAEGATHVGRGRPGKKRIIEDDDDGGGFWPPLPTTVPAPKQLPVPTITSERTIQIMMDTNGSTETAVAGGNVEASVVEHIDLPAAETAPVAAANPAVVMDPAALSKLFELCEGMKQQNEELKQQLRDQQSVLASLAVATTATTAAPTPAKSVSNRSIPPTKKSSKPDVEQKSRDTKTRKNTTPSTATEAKEVTTKPASKKPALMKPKAVRKSEPRDASTPTKVASVAISDSSDAPSTIHVPPQPTLAKPSRLLQPRVVPRLRSAQALAAKTSSNLDAPVATSNAEATTATANTAPDPLAEPVLEAAVEESPPHHDEASDEVEFPSVSGEMIPTDPVHEHEHKQSPLSLPRLLPSPPNRRKSVPSRKPAASESESLPLLTTRSSFSHITDDCLDSTASSTSTRVSRPFFMTHTRLHALDEGDLDAQCSSVTMLDGSSAMVPCSSILSTF